MTKEQAKPSQTENIMPPLFNKEALVNADRYKAKRDLLQALLENGGQYSLEQTDKLIEKFMKGRG